MNNKYFNPALLAAYIVANLIIYISLGLKFTIIDNGVHLGSIFVFAGVSLTALYSTYWLFRLVKEKNKSIYTERKKEENISKLL